MISDVEDRTTDDQTCDFCEERAGPATGHIEDGEIVIVNACFKCRKADKPNWR